MRRNRGPGSRDRAFPTRKKGEREREKKKKKKKKKKKVERAVLTIY
jgi:hypothetical protein